MGAVQSAHLDLTLEALDDIQKQEQEFEFNWRLCIERAQYEADRCDRQFNLVAPPPLGSGNRTCRRLAAQKIITAKGSYQGIIYNVCQSGVARFQ